MSQNKPIATMDQSCSIFERALDALPDGVLLVNAAREVAYANTAFKKLWRIPSDLLASKDDSQMLRYAMEQLADPAGFLREVERLHPTSQTSEDEILFKDGRIIARRSLPFEEGGRLSARIWIFTDVTEAKNASVDQLTGLPNRLAFSRQFPQFVTAPSDGLSRAVAILDVDNFKSYNDLYGHARGDRTLKEIGTILQSHVYQTGDLAFRIGGEEFLIAKRVRASPEATAFFEKIRASVAAMKIAHLGNPPYNMVSMSIGYGTFSSAPEANTVFNQVDEALYRAKAQGRNRIVEAVF
ncbi:diguanylate cyclase domain-containing protein [Sphingobium sp. CR28]|uniref:diguanylate cyclase domain-containing protein n=1 Tax=Sphingobium sp. CR28 TaxID=3400272 RepID=UPI003FEFFFB3